VAQASSQCASAELDTGEMPVLLIFEIAVFSNPQQLANHLDNP
jgi:hypothetical protein